MYGQTTKNEEEKPSSLIYYTQLEFIFLKIVELTPVRNSRL